MAVRIRLSRFGRLHRPFFRIIAIDSRRHREGEASEILGSYDPQAKEKNVIVDLTRVESWVERGAQISDSLRHLLKFAGYQVPVAKKTVAVAPAVPRADADKARSAKSVPSPSPKRTWTKPTRRALRKHAAAAKVVRKAALAQAATSKPAAEAEASAAPAATAPAT